MPKPRAKPKTRRKRRLPNKLIVLKNKDKAFHEKWYEGRNILNIPHPARFLLLGPPNSGKTMIIKNAKNRSEIIKAAGSPVGLSIWTPTKTVCVRPVWLITNCRWLW